MANGVASPRRRFAILCLILAALAGCETNGPGSSALALAFAPPRPRSRSTPRATAAAPRRSPPTPLAAPDVPAHAGGAPPRGRVRRAGAVAAALAAAPPSSASEDRRGVVVRRAEYEEPPFWIARVDLDVNILGRGDDGKRPDAVAVASRLRIARNERTNPHGDRDLVLDGDADSFSLRSLSLDGRDLVEGTDYEATPSGALRIAASCLRGKDRPTLSAVVEHRRGGGGGGGGGGRADAGSDLEGMFHRDGFWCTHCESTGFSKITYFLDRPDNTAVFESVRIEADKAAYPTLLSNGNPVESGDCGGGRHYAIYSDPHPKPCYIFGLLAAGAETNIDCLVDTYKSERSGREVKLQVFGTADKLYRLTFAMDSLKRAMAWEEETYGLEYDLDVYTIVALRHYSIGAMENKGLNFFLESLVAADPTTTTDVTYDLIEKTIAHEYLHNWTGNRVTVRDWFEMALKEGLTVFRDQEFCMDVGLKTAVRIETVKMLRAKQFVEDAAVDSQPVRPDSYTTIEDLWSTTAYHKGAEICRMYKTMLGAEGFRRGLGLYTSRYDGTGATLENLNQAMADANSEFDDDASRQFALWFFTPGTPTVTFEHSYASGTFTLKLSQTSRSKDGPLLIPIAVGLMDRMTGREAVRTVALNLREDTQVFEFSGLDGDVVPSLLRDFSAPIHLLPASGEEDDGDIAFRACFDTDLFNRWEAIQKLLRAFVGKLLRNEDAGGIKSCVHKAFASVLSSDIDPSSKAYMLQLPTEFALHRETEARIDPNRIHVALMTVKRHIARTFKSELQDSYEQLSMNSDNGPVQTDPMSRAHRALRNVFLDYLCCVDDTPEEQAEVAQLAMRHFDDGKCLTDRLFAYRKLVSMDNAARDASIDKFYEISKREPSLLVKWFQTQALSDLPDVLERVQILTRHPSFQATNAALFRALIVGFTLNLNAFHHKSGKGYRFIGSICSQIDRVSPSLSVALASKLAQWHRFDEHHGEIMKLELKKLASMEKKSEQLSKLLDEALHPSSAGAEKGSQPSKLHTAPKKGKNKKKAKAKPKKASHKGGFGSK